MQLAMNPRPFSRTANMLQKSGIHDHIMGLRWCRARDLFGPQIAVTTVGFELRISCIQSCYLTH